MKTEHSFDICGVEVEKLIASHNEKMDLIARTSERTGFSGATLFYAAAFGIINVVDTPNIVTEQKGFNEPIKIER